MSVQRLVLASAALAACGRLGFDSDAPPPLLTDPGLLAYWPLDELAGATTFSDRSGHANHGSCTACPSAGITGVRGTAIELGEMDAAIEVASSATLRALAGPVTIAAWVRREGLTDWGAIVSTDRDCCGTYDGYSLWAQHYKRGPAMLTWSANAHLARDETELALGVWSHLVGTYDGSFNRIYIDGVETTAVPSAGIAAPHSFELWLGSMAYAAPQYHFVGAIDEVLILGRALDAGEVVALRDAY